MLTRPNFGRTKGLADIVNLPSTYTLSKNLILSVPESSKSDLTIFKSQEYCCELNAAVFFCFLFQYMLILQFRVCNDDFLSAPLHETQSEIKPV